MMLDLFLGACFGGGVTALLIEVMSKRPQKTEVDELRDMLADAAVEYCEEKRTNRLESFQLAKWQRYCAIAEGIEEAGADRGPVTISNQLRKVWAHIRRTLQ
jgi:hypothetical protein